MKVDPKFLIGGGVIGGLLGWWYAKRQATTPAGQMYPRGPSLGGDMVTTGQTGSGLGGDFVVTGLSTAQRGITDSLIQQFFRSVPLPQDRSKHIDCHYWMNLSRAGKLALVSQYLMSYMQMGWFTRDQAVAQIDAYCLRQSINTVHTLVPGLNRTAARPAGVLSWNGNPDPIVPASMLPTTRMDPNAMAFNLASLKNPMYRP